MIQYSPVKNMCSNNFESENVWLFISKDLDEGKVCNMVQENISSYLPLSWDKRDDKIFQLQKDSAPEFYCFTNN